MILKLCKEKIVQMRYKNGTPGIQTVQMGYGWQPCALSQRHILIHTLTYPHPHTYILTHPPQKYHHSTQDQILHRAQPTRQPVQFHERISARITLKSFLKILIFRLRTLLFLR